MIQAQALTENKLDADAIVWAYETLALDSLWTGYPQAAKAEKYAEYMTTLATLAGRQEKWSVQQFGGSYVISC